MSPKPTIVLVHGSWLSPGFYSKLVDHLTDLGYPVTCPLLPSCSPSATVDTDLIDDALAVRGVLTRLIEYESKSVILLMHSYGGLVGSEALPESLTLSSRQKEGLKGGVQYLVYLAAFMLPAGQSCESFYGQMGGSVEKDGFYFNPKVKEEIFSDVPSDEADDWIAKMVRHPFKIQQTTTTRAAYTFTPSTYVVFTLDKGNPPPAQEHVAGVMNSKVIKFESGHMGFITKPIEVGDTIHGVIQSIV